MPAALSLSPDLSTLTAAAVVAVVAAIVFVESGLLLGFLLPGDTVLFAAGLLSADPATGLSLPLLVAAVLAAAVAGDGVGYALGRRAGRPLLERREGRVLNADTLRRAEAFYHRWGALAVVVARWIPWVRTATPVLAGVARMPYPRFLLANVVGALAWAAGLLVLGHLAASAPWLRHAAYAVAGASVALSLVLPWVRRRWQRRPADRGD